MLGYEKIQPNVRAYFGGAVNGEQSAAEYFAYMEFGINWEIWLESGNNSLPLFFVLL